MRQQALEYARTHQDEALNGLIELLRIPSISALPAHQPDIHRAAQWLVDRLTAIGLENARIIPTDGHPLVYADWLHAAGAPTLLVYGHYDVQPVDPLDEWHTPPFEPTIQGDKLYARGADDNKGQFFAHVAAVEAYLKSAGQLPVNLKFILEGEEEVGSPNLDKFIQHNQDLLRADALLISDTPMADPDTPVVVTGVRGLVYTEIFMQGPRRDLHSGAYGGAVHNPLNALVKVLAALHDEQGRVTVPGFYDDVQELTPAEREAINAGPLTEESVLAETGAPALWGEPGYTVAERLSVRPTLDIHGIKGGFIGEGGKTVIPAKASAKVSMRLVPHQDPHKIARQFADYVRRLSPPTVTVEVVTHAAADSAVVDIADPAVQAAGTACELAFGRRPLFQREGGTLPIVATFGKVLGAPVVMMGLGLPDDNIHAPNERFHLPNFYRGIEAAIHYYDIFSTVAPRR
ncbi:MAG: dipeptidase [Chloroflexi bacterium]|nr:MAG: dipeptidase [Chloroflexota bacterium]